MSQTMPLLLQTNQPFILGVLIIIGLVALALVFLVAKFARLWLQAYFSRADIKLTELIGMWLRKVDMRTPADLSRYFREEVMESAEVQYASE